MGGGVSRPDIPTRIEVCAIFAQSTLRKFATPLTIGASLLLGVTGILLFFRANTGLNKLAHEWVGPAFVAIVALHVAVNWRPFVAHLKCPLGQAAAVLFAALLALSFLPLGGGQGQAGDFSASSRALSGHQSGTASAPAPCRASQGMQRSVRSQWQQVATSSANSPRASRPARSAPLTLTPMVRAMPCVSQKCFDSLHRSSIAPQAVTSRARIASSRSLLRQ